MQYAPNGICLRDFACKSECVILLDRRTGKRTVPGFYKFVYQEMWLLKPCSQIFSAIRN